MLEKKIKHFVLVVAIVVAAFGVSLNWIAPVNGQQAQGQATQAQANAEETMEQKYKNIQALKGLPASQMRAMMNYISASTGMTCGECHVKNGDQWAFEKDDNNHKVIARRMITMTMDINKASFNGRTQVTCYTCHQGHDHPSHVPPLVAPKAAEAPAAAPAPASGSDVRASAAAAAARRRACTGSRNCSPRGRTRGRGPSSIRMGTRRCCRRPPCAFRRYGAFSRISGARR